MLRSAGGKFSAHAGAAKVASGRLQFPGPISRTLSKRAERFVKRGTCRAQDSTALCIAWHPENNDLRNKLFLQEFYIFLELFSVGSGKQYRLSASQARRRHSQQDRKQSAT